MLNKLFLIGSVLINKIFIFALAFLAHAKYNEEELDRLLLLFPIILAIQPIYTLGTTNWYLKNETSQNGRNIVSYIFANWCHLLVISLILIVAFYSSDYLSVNLVIFGLVGSASMGLIDVISTKSIAEQNGLHFFLISAFWKLIMLIIFAVYSISLDQLLFVFASLAFVSLLLSFIIVRPIKSYSGALRALRRNPFRNLNDSGITEYWPMLLNVIFTAFIIVYNKIYSINFQSSEAIVINTIMLVPGIYLTFYMVFYKIYTPIVYKMFSTDNLFAHKWEMPRLWAKMLFFIGLIFIVISRIFLNLYDIDSFENRMLCNIAILVYILYYLYALKNDLIILLDGGKTTLILNVVYFIFTILFREKGYLLFGQNYMLYHLLLINGMSILVLHIREFNRLKFRVLRSVLISVLCLIIAMLIVEKSLILLCFLTVVMILLRRRDFINLVLK